MTLPEIKGFLELSFSDWPGRVASVVFLPGCSFRCPYCHNHRLVTEPGSLASWPPREVFARLDRLDGWVDGVCVTGGEPTLHPGLAALLERFRSRGLGVKLDTNGSRPRVIEALLARGLVEEVSLDVKAPLEPVPYRRNAGSGSAAGAVGRTLEVLLDSPLPLELRTTVHPALLGLEELLRLARDLGRRTAGRSPRVRWTLQRCRTDETLDPALRDLPPLPPETFRRWQEAALQAFADASQG